MDKPNDSLNIQHLTLNTSDGVRLHVAQAGPADGPLVVLLHGFPEFWYSWRAQIAPLAAAGYRVWVPDQRGYNRSDKPPRVRDYTIETLAADVLGLLDAAGAAQATIIGHDWGAAVTWWLAAYHPDRVARAAVLNVPHPAVMARTIRRSWRQLRKSWYIFFFQLPWLPEKLLARRDWALARRSLLRTSRRGTFSAADMACYAAAWGQPGAMRGMINWYRAVRYTAGKAAEPRRVTVPLHIIWGKKDAFLTADMASESLKLCDQGQLTFLPAATHWVQHEEPEKVNELLLEFLRSE